jgi:hypothetical protein
LVFWRGVGVQRRTGRFVLAKLDLLIQRGLNIFKAALSPILPSPKVLTATHARTRRRLTLATRR